MPGIFTEGEFSLFFFGGRFSHAIVKRPASGDFRVQEQFGGREMAWNASDAARLLAAQALAAAPAPPVYPRVDLVGDAAGPPHILDLELIQPSLFLPPAPATAPSFRSSVFLPLLSVPPPPPPF